MRSWVWSMVFFLIFASVPGAAGAVNWVRVGSGEWYIDAETVRQDGNTLDFWEYSESPDGSQKYLRRFAVEMREPPPYHARQLYGCSYRRDRTLLAEEVRVHSFLIGPLVNAELLEAIAAARPHAQAGTGSEVIPELPGER